MSHGTKIFDTCMSGKIIRRSRNLRGLLDHARRTAVLSAYVRNCDHGEADLIVQYANGNFGTAHFASFAVCRDWVRSRRSWGLKHTKTDTIGIEFA